MRLRPHRLRVGPRYNVMNLELTQRSTSLAVPSVTLQYGTPQSPIYSIAEL
jgi:hypothetical protein